jgi:hypothetical protein
MNLATTLLFYILIGGAVAVAVFGVDRGGPRWFRTLTAAVFWPLYVPALLQQPANPNADSNRSTGEDIAAGDEIAAAIQQVETELDLALMSLGGWSDAVLAREQHRFEELRLAWHAQAEKIRDLDRILGQLVPTDAAVDDPAAKPGDRIASSHRARQSNITRLHALRDRLHADLMNTLAWVRELVTMIHLAKYTGAPASRAEELVLQIATSIEGLSEVAAWRGDDGSMTILPASLPASGRRFAD